jgi:hypothetical protein
MKTIKFKNAYQSGGFYDAVLNRPKNYKLGEALSFTYILEQSNIHPTNILELMSGVNSYHKKFFMENFHNLKNFDKYKGLDLYSKDPLDIKEDIDTGDFPEFDLMLGFYYLSASFVDYSSSNRVTKDKTVKCFSNIFNNLKPNGNLIFDYEGFLDLPKFLSTWAGHHSESKVIPLGHKLRVELKHELKNLPEPYTMVLDFSYKYSYDRLTSNVLIEYYNVYVNIQGNRFLKIKIEDPLCFRYFSEPEMTDILKEVGFVDIQYWSCDYDRQYNEPVPLVYSDRESLPSVGNVILCRKPNV